MNAEFINLTPENLSDEHVCCIIRKNAHNGIEKIIKKHSTSKHQISGK